tara:strand:+ start:272 stop:451 length:180 start_codon:yes stop_codon:yes gene_type:complete
LLFLGFFLKIGKPTREINDMQKYGQKTPMKSGKGTKQNKSAANAAGIRVSGAKPAFPPK